MNSLSGIYRNMYVAIILIFLTGCSTPSQSQTNSTEEMKNEKVKIEIWSDVVCPFCFIGKKKIEETVKALNVQDQVEIVWHSYQLDPSFPADTSMLYYPYHNQRSGYTEAQLQPMGQRLNQVGEPYDITYNFEKIHVVNSFNLHRLLLWSQQFGLYNELNEALMRAYFTDGIDLSKQNELLKIVASVGLNKSIAITVLNSNKYKAEVTADISQSRQLGISGVPYFLINGTEKISGAQNNRVFEKAIMNAISQENEIIETEDTEICIPGSNCKI